jgi:NitT/TauT family transport system substrate-binding protein
MVTELHRATIRLCSYTAVNGPFAGLFNFKLYQYQTRDILVTNGKNNGWTRREFLATAGLAGVGAFLGVQSEGIAAESPPETTKLRLPQGTSTCQAPMYVAEQLLRTEGFSDVTYVKQSGAGIYKSLGSGEVDISVTFVAPFILEVDAGKPVVLLGSVHVGC